LMMVMMTTVLMCSVFLYATLVIKVKVKGFFFLLLLLTTGMLGVFCARDLFLFYVFWEITLIPMYFLIGIWGSERRIYAAIKFFLFTMAGSVLMLVGMLYLVFANQAATGVLTFDLHQLLRLGLPPELQTWLFLAFAISFAIKVPLFPFHTWLPVAHVEAPTAASMVLAGVMLKLGTYGMVRFCIPLFPQAAHEFWPVIATLSVIGIIYGGLVAMVQPDLKKLIAYSSVSHLGFVVLGCFALTTQGMSGGILQMVNHGINSAALFMAVGILYERRHTKLIADFGGIAKSMPVYAVFFMLFMLGSIGVPLTNGFVGEFLIILGVFRVSPMFAALAALGVIISAMYMLRAYQRVFFGVPKGANSKLKDLCPREIIAFLPLAALVLVLGFFPNILLDKISANVEFTVHTSSLPHLQSKAELPAEQLTGQEVLELAPAEETGLSSGPVEEQSSQPDVKTINRENSSDHT
jgi:NADH-quinone oxidoreductase subunit M